MGEGVRDRMTNDKGDSRKEKKGGQKSEMQSLSLLYLESLEQGTVPPTVIKCSVFE